MREAIVRHLDEIREAVRLRAPYFEKGARRLAVYDLMAPAPQQGKNAVPALIPYAEGIDIVKKALGAVHPEMSDFIELMGRCGAIGQENRRSLLFALQ